MRPPSPQTDDAATFEHWYAAVEQPTIRLAALAFTKTTPSRPATTIASSSRSIDSEPGATAEPKVPFEVMCLADAATTGHVVRPFRVLGGDGRKPRDCFISGQRSEHLIHANRVRVTLEAFNKLANTGVPLSVLAFTLAVFA